jgi:hypothetical protein
MHWLSTLEGIFRSRSVDFCAALAAFLGGMTLRDRYRNHSAVRNLRQAAEAGNSEPYLRAAAEGGAVGDQLTLADFLIGKGRTDDAFPLLYKIAEQRGAGHLRTLGSLFRRAGLDNEARKYYDQADEWDKLLDALEDVDDSPP